MQKLMFAALTLGAGVSFAPFMLTSAIAQNQAGGTTEGQCQPSAQTKVITVAEFYRLIEKPPVVRTEKDEFESTAEYQARLASQNIKIPESDVSVGDHVVIDFPVGEQLQYDADRRLLKVKNLGLDYTGIFPIKLKQGSFQGTAINTQLRSETFYNGSNAFGAQIRVRRQEVDLVAIAWPKKTVKVRKHSKQLTFRNYPADQAKAFRDKGKIRVMGKIISPVAERAPTLATTPTFSNPLERRNTFAVLTVVPSDVCLISHNGQVIDQWLIEPRKSRK